MNPVSGIPFWHIILYFVGYLIIHVLIGWQKGIVEKDLKKHSEDEETKNAYRILSFSFKWFPFGYTLFVILMLLF